MASSTFKEEFLGFYKECYYFEMDRKDKIRQQLGLAVAVLALLCNIVSYYFSNFKFSSFMCSHLWFYVPFIIGASFAIIAFIYLMRYFFSIEEYAYIPTPKAIRDAINEGMEQSKSEDAVKNFYIEKLSEQYSECATHNQRNNTKRTGYVFSSLKSSLISILFLLLTFPGFFLFSNKSPVNNSKHVEVLTVSEQQASPDNPDETDVNAPPDQPVQAPDPAEASSSTSTIDVEWPSIEYIKEADEKNAE